MTPGLCPDVCRGIYSDVKGIVQREHESCHEVQLGASGDIPDLSQSFL